MTSTEPHDAGEYSGTVTVVAEPSGGAEPVTVELSARLRATFQPIDGRLHWYGRLAADETLSRLRGGSTIELRTAGGSAAGRLSDPDPWGRLRVTGTGRPPF